MQPNALLTWQNFIIVKSGCYSGLGSQVPFGVFKVLWCFLVLLELMLLLEELEEREPLTPSQKMNLLRTAMHLVSFCTSWRLLGEFLFMIVDIFSGSESIPRWETIYQSSFLEARSNIHFSEFNFMLSFLRLSKVSAR
jgi:hypothetical protein